LLPCIDACHTNSPRPCPGVAKLYDLKPELAIENGFVESLKEMVGDANPMVVANAVTALMDIHLASQVLLENGGWPFLLSVPFFPPFPPCPLASFAHSVLFFSTSILSLALAATFN
jgi:non-SMC mitotic condensation complex subunit 1